MTPPGFKARDARRNASLVSVKFSSVGPRSSGARTGMGWWFPEMSGADRGSLTFNIDVALRAAVGPDIRITRSA